MIDKLLRLFNERNNNYEEIKDLQEKNENISKEIKEIFNNKELKDIIIDALEEEIKIKGTRLSSSNYTRYVEHPMKIKSGDEWVVCETDYSRYKFYPDVDEWEVVDIQTKLVNGEPWYRVQVEAIKNREFIGPFNWTLDTYWTTWFKK